MILSEFLHVLVIDHDQRGQIRATIPDHDRVRDVGRELELVLDLGRRDVLPARRDDDVFHTVGDVEIAFVVHAPDIACVQPAVAQGFGGLFRLVQVTHEHRRAADQQLTFR